MAVSGYLAGSTFTLADMYLTPLLGYLVMFPESGAMIRAAEHLWRYYAVHSVCDSFLKTTPPPMGELGR